MKHLKKMAKKDYSHLVGKLLKDDLDMGPIDESKSSYVERAFIVDGKNLMELSNDEAILVSAKAGLMYGEDFVIPAGAEVTEAKETVNGNLEATFKANGHNIKVFEIAFDSEEDIDSFFA